jgi:hypothetical protein
MSPLDIAIGIVIVGALVYFINKRKQEVESVVEAPVAAYKVETPVVEEVQPVVQTAPVVEAPVAAPKKARAKKAPAEKQATKQPATKKQPASAKQPAKAKATKAVVKKAKIRVAK